MARFKKLPLFLSLARPELGSLLCFVALEIFPRHTSSHSATMSQLNKGPVSAASLCLLELKNEKLLFFLLNVFNLQVIASEEEKSALVLFYEIPLPRPRDLLRRKRFFQVVCCRVCRGLSCGATINKYLCFFLLARARPSARRRRLHHHECLKNALSK